MVRGAAVVLVVLLQEGFVMCRCFKSFDRYLWLLGGEEVAVWFAVLYTINHLIFLLIFCGWSHVPPHAIAMCTSLSHIHCMLVTSHSHSHCKLVIFFSHCHCMLVTSLLHSHCMLVTSLSHNHCILVTSLSLLHRMLALFLSLAHCMLHHFPLPCTLYVASRTSHTLDIFSILVLSVMCLLHFLNCWCAGVDAQGSKKNAIYWCLLSRYVCWI